MKLDAVVHMYFLSFLLKVSRGVAFPTRLHVHPAKIQISLLINRNSYCCFGKDETNDFKYFLLLLFYYFRLYKSAKRIHDVYTTSHERRELQKGKRSNGGHKKRYKDTLKAFLKDFKMLIESRERIAQGRAKWRGHIKREAGEYEVKR